MKLDNRRWSTRIKQNLSLRYRAASMQFQTGRLINLSYSGARLLVSRREAEAGPFLQLQLELSNGEVVKVTAKQMWQTEAGADTVVVGVRFHQADTKAKAQLADWIANCMWTEYAA